MRCTAWAEMRARSASISARTCCAARACFSALACEAGVEVDSLMLRHHLCAEDACVDAQARQRGGFQRLKYRSCGSVVLLCCFDYARIQRRSEGW